MKLSYLIILLLILLVNCMTLFDASKIGDLENTQSLINNGANVNAKDDLGWTPLHYAAYNGHTNTVKYLVTKGADKQIKNPNGATAFDLAKLNSHADIEAFLIGEKSNQKNNADITKADIKPNSDSSKWSENQGQLNWNDAKTKCTKLKMKLPTQLEFQAAHKGGVMGSWQNGIFYWLSDEYSKTGAYFFDINGEGEISYTTKTTKLLVRCLR